MMSCTFDFPVPRLTYRCIVYSGASTRPGELQQLFFSRGKSCWNKISRQITCSYCFTLGSGSPIPDTKMSKLCWAVSVGEITRLRLRASRRWTPVNVYPLGSLFLVPFFNRGRAQIAFSPFWAKSLVV